jgi:hypothetical protein
MLQKPAEYSKMPLAFMVLEGRAYFSITKDLKCTSFTLITILGTGLN